MDVKTARSSTSNPATAARCRLLLHAFLLLSTTATMPLSSAALPPGGRDINLSSSLGNLRGRKVRNTEKRPNLSNVDSPRHLQSEPQEEGFPNEVAIREDLVFRYKLVSVDSGNLQEERAPQPFNAISVEMVYEGLAWIGFAIADPDGEMVGSEAVIGIPEGGPPTNPSKYFLGGKSVDSVVLMDDSQQTLIDAEIVQDESFGVTTLTFTKLLAEPGELVINAMAGNNQNTFLWAIGSGNELGYHGGGRGSFDVELDIDSTGVTDETTTELTNSTVEEDSSCYYFNGTRISRQPGELLAGPTITCMCDVDGSGRWVNCFQSNDGDNADENGDDDSSSSQPSSQPTSLPSNVPSSVPSSTSTPQPSSTPSSLPSNDRDDVGDENDEEGDEEDDGAGGDASAGASCHYNGNWRQPGEWLTGPTLTCMCDSNGSGAWTNCRESDEGEVEEENDEGDEEDEGSNNSNNYGY